MTLSDVAEFRMASGAINISRENAQRVKAVSIFIAGRDMGSVVADMRKRVDACSCRKATGWSGPASSRTSSVR